MIAWQHDGLTIEANHNIDDDDPLYLYLTIGSHCGRIMSYDMYKDTMVVKRIGVPPWLRDAAEPRKGFLDKWGMSHDGHLQKIRCTHTPEEILDTVKTTTARFMMEELKDPIISCTKKGTIVVYDQKNLFGLKVLAWPEYFGLYGYRRFRKYPFTGSLCVDHYNLLLIPVKDVVRKFAANVKDFADPFAGKAVGEDTLVTMEK